MSAATKIAGCSGFGGTWFAHLGETVCVAAIRACARASINIAFPLVIDFEEGRVDRREFPGSAREQEERVRNRVTVERYMSSLGQERLRRHLLFTEDGIGGLWTNDTGAPIAIRGRDRLAEHALWSLQCFPDWKWINIAIFETQDPGFFWVECDGEGAIRFPGYAEGRYENHFLHSFELAGGLIRRQREFMNPFEQLRALGIPVPEVRRDGIPT